VRKLQHHEGASFSRGSQVNRCLKEWRQNHQIKALVVVQVGEFHEHGDWRRIKRS
jgi:hypothetical protein